MKRFFIVMLCVVLSVGVALSCAACGGVSGTTYLRIHIRANSNGATDQEVKYAVRDAVVSFLTPKLKQVGTYENAVKEVSKSLNDVVSIADGVLKKEGFCYGAKAAIREEDFPTRKYDDVVLKNGRYQALIVELGTGTGDNWWCVAYPPLCFGGGDDYQIRSAILDFFHSLF